jgi:glycosyltransferase involved in cell wall biosynthesis
MNNNNNNKDNNTAPKNILYVQHELTRVGSSLSLYYLIKKLDRTKFNPVIVCSRKSEEMSALYEELGVRIIIASIPSYIHIRLSVNKIKQWLRALRFLLLFPGAYLRLRRIIREMNISLVHINTLALPVAAIAARSMSVPVVWHIREVIAQGTFGIRKSLLERTIDKCADKVIAISNDEARALNVKRNVTVINNSVDFSVFDRNVSGAGIRREFAISSETICIGTIASVDPLKGIYEFIEAARIIKQHIDNVKFFIVGEQISKKGNKWLNPFFRIFRLEEDHVKNVKGRINDYDLGQYIFLTGVRNDIPSIIAAMDVIVCPYRLSAIGRPAIEAAAMGKPVVAASLNPGNGIVIDKVTGVLFPPGDAERLAESIMELLKDKGKANALGERALDYARQNFDTTMNTRKIMKIYDNLPDMLHDNRQGKGNAY